MCCEDVDKDWSKWEYALQQLEGVDLFSSDLALDDVCLEVRSLGLSRVVVALFAFLPRRCSGRLNALNSK